MKNIKEYSITGVQFRKTGNIITIISDSQDGKKNDSSKHCTGKAQTVLR